MVRRCSRHLGNARPGTGAIHRDRRAADDRPHTGSRQGQGSGVEVNLHVASIWTVRDGKIVGLETHRSLEDALEAARLSE